MAIPPPNTSQPTYGAVCLVEPAGTIALGPAYVRARVEGLTLEAAEKVIEKQLNRSAAVRFPSPRRTSDPVEMFKEAMINQSDVQVTLPPTWEGAKGMLRSQRYVYPPGVRRQRRAPAPQDSAPPSQR